MVKKHVMIIAICFFLGGLYFGFLAHEIWFNDHPEKPQTDSLKTNYMESVFHRHGYKEEELMAELENENGVRLYSDQAGDLYFVYGSTSVPDASYRIEKHSWVKK